MALEVNLAVDKNSKEYLTNIKKNQKHPVYELNIIYPNKYNITVSDIKWLAELLYIIPIRLSFTMKMNQIIFYDGDDPTYKGIHKISDDTVKSIFMSSIADERIKQELLNLEKIILYRHTMGMIQMRLITTKKNIELEYLKDFIAKNFDNSIEALEEILKQHLIFMVEPHLTYWSQINYLPKFDSLAHRRIATYDTLGILDYANNLSIFKIFLDIYFVYLKNLDIKIGELSIYPFQYGFLDKSSFEESELYHQTLIKKLDTLIESNEKLAIHTIRLGMPWDYNKDEEIDLLFKYCGLFKQLGIEQLTLSKKHITDKCLKAITEYVKSDSSSIELKFEYSGSSKQLRSKNIGLYLNYHAAISEKIRRKKISDLKNPKVELKLLPAIKSKNYEVTAPKISLISFVKPRKANTRRYKKAFLSQQEIEANNIALQYAYAIEEQQIFTGQPSDKAEIEIIIQQEISKQLNKQEFINYKKMPIDFPILSRKDLTNIERFSRSTNVFDIYKYLYNYVDYIYPYNEIDNDINYYGDYSSNDFSLHLFDHLFGGATYKEDSLNHISFISIPALTELLANREHLSSGLNWFSLPQHFVFVKQDDKIILHFDKKYLHDNITPLSLDFTTKNQIIALSADLLTPEYLTKQERLIYQKFIKKGKLKNLTIDRLINIFLWLYPAISSLPILNKNQINELIEIIYSEGVQRQKAGTWHPHLGYFEADDNYLNRLKSNKEFKQLTKIKAINKHHSLKNIINCCHKEFFTVFTKLIGRYGFNNKNLSATAVAYYNYGIVGVKKVFASLAKIDSIVVNEESYYLAFKSSFIDCSSDLSWLVDNNFDDDVTQLIEIAKEPNKFYWWKKLTIENIADNKDLYPIKQQDFNKQLKAFNYFLDEINKLNPKVYLPEHGSFNIPLINDKQILSKFIQEEYAKFEKLPQQNKSYSNDKLVSKFLTHNDSNMLVIMERVLFILKNVSRPDLTILQLVTGRINLSEACYAIGVENFDTIVSEMQLNLELYVKGYRYNTTLNQVKHVPDISKQETMFYRYCCMHGNYSSYSYNKSVLLEITKRKIPIELQNKLIFLAALTLSNISNIPQNNLINIFEENYPINIIFDSINNYFENNKPKLDFYSAIRLINILKDTEDHKLVLDNIYLLFEFNKDIAEICLANCSIYSALFTNDFNQVFNLQPLQVLYLSLLSANKFVDESKVIEQYSEDDLISLIDSKIKIGNNLLLKIVEPDSDDFIKKILQSYNSKEKHIVENLIATVGCKSQNYKLEDYLYLDKFLIKLKTKQNNLFKTILPLLNNALDLKFYDASQLSEMLQLITEIHNLISYNKIKLIYEILNFGLTKSANKELIIKLNWLINENKSLSLIKIYLQVHNELIGSERERITVLLDENHSNCSTIIKLASSANNLKQLKQLLKYTISFPEVEHIASFFPNLDMLYNIISIVKKANNHDVKALHLILVNILKKIPKTRMEEESAILGRIFSILGKLSPNVINDIANLYASKINPSVKKLANVLAKLDSNKVKIEDLINKLVLRNEFEPFQEKVNKPQYHSEIIAAINKIHSEFGENTLDDSTKNRILNDYIYIDQIANGIKLSIKDKINLSQCPYNELPFADIINKYKTSDDKTKKHIYKLQYIAAIYNMIVHIKDFEPRLEQLLVILHTLYIDDVNPLFGIVSGEGKTLIIAILAATKWLADDAQTIEILTTTKTLASESYHQYKDLYNAIGIPSKLLFSDAPGDSYIKGGINVSTVHEFILYQLKYCILGDEKYDENSLAIVDEFDKNYDYQPPCNISKILHPIDYAPIFSIIYDYLHSNYFIHGTTAAEDVISCLNYIEKHSEFVFKQLHILYEDKPEQLRLFIDDVIESFLRTNFYRKERDFIITEEISYITLASQKLRPLMDGYPAGNQVSFALMDQQTLSTRLNKIALRNNQDILLPILPQPTILASKTPHNLLTSYSKGRLYGFTGTTGTIAELKHANHYYKMFDYQYPRHIKHKREIYQPDFYSNNNELFEVLVLKIKCEQEMGNPTLIFCEDDSQVNALFKYISNLQDNELTKANLQKFTANETINEHQILNSAAEAKAITFVSNAWNRGIHIKVKSTLFLSVYLIYHQDKFRELLQISYRTGRESPGKTECLIAIDRFNLMNSFYLNEIKRPVLDIKKYSKNVETLHEIANLKELARLNKCYIYINRSDMHNKMQNDYLSLIKTLERKQQKRSKSNIKMELAISEIKSNWYNIVTNSLHRIWDECFANHKDMLKYQIPELSSKELLDQALARYNKKLGITWNKFIDFITVYVLKEILHFSDRQVKDTLNVINDNCNRITSNNKSLQPFIADDNLDGLSRPKLVYFKYQSTINNPESAADISFLYDNCRDFYNELTRQIRPKHRSVRISQFVQRSIICKIFKTDYELISIEQKQIINLKPSTRNRFILTNTPSSVPLFKPTWKLYWQEKSKAKSEIKIDNVAGLRKFLNGLGSINPGVINKEMEIRIIQLLDAWLAMDDSQYIKHVGQIELVDLLNIMLEHKDINKSQYADYLDEISNLVPRSAVDYDFPKLYLK